MSEQFVVKPRWLPISSIITSYVITPDRFYTCWLWQEYRNHIEDLWLGRVRKVMFTRNNHGNLEFELLMSDDYQNDKNLNIEGSWSRITHWADDPNYKIKILSPKESALLGC